MEIKQSFFSVSDNNHSKKGQTYPWAYRIESGKGRRKECQKCKRGSSEIKGEIELLCKLNRKKGWPDVLNCVEPLLIVSEKVVEDWSREEIGGFPLYKATVFATPDYQSKNGAPPQYYWIDGKQLLGAKMDFEASGYVDVGCCSECGSNYFDIKKTGERQRSGNWPAKFVEGSWDGSHLFTTDLSPAAFYCTEKVVECAKRNKHTNFCFVPLEKSQSTVDGID